MRIIKYTLLLAIILSTLGFNAWAATADSSSFVVKAIQFNGLHRIDRNTVLAYLPTKVGSRMTPADATRDIKTLYQTGFFSYISMERQGNTLIANVTERPVIGSINITGNNLIKTKLLKKVLNDKGVMVGNEFNKAKVSQIQTALQQEYFSQGKYNAKVEIQVVPRTKEQVDLNVKISEGRTATIRGIKIVGNHVFPEHTLLKQMSMSTPTFLSFLSHNDDFSQQKLAADLKTLEAYYYNRGYIEFKVLSHQVEITPNREYVYVTINVSEGHQYRFGKFDFKWVDANGQHAIKPVLSDAKLRSLLGIKTGEIFSRELIENAGKAMQTALGDKGYALAEIKPETTQDSKHHTADFTFVLSPGNKMYVDHISFSGNNATNDAVLRRAVQQKEDALYSQTDIDNSTFKLHQLPFLKGVQLEKTPVKGTNNQMDLNYKVSEVPAASANFGVGYSQLNGILLMIGVTQQNFLGEGKTVGVNFTTSSWQRVYQFNYFNPFFTKDGIGFGYSVFYQQNDLSDANAADYAIDNYGFSSYFSVPLSLRTTVSLGGGFNHTKVKLGNKASTQLNNFVNTFGSTFQNANITGSVTYTGLDRVVFPTKGISASLNGLLALPTTKRSFEYFTATAKAQGYYPLSKGFIVAGRAEMDYGDGFGRSSMLPFYKNFFAGGMGSVAGYEDNTLGPVDSNNDPLGGNLAVDGALSLIFPNPISPDNLRTSVFIDAGNVYNTNPDSKFDGANTGGLRYSVGVEADWLSPFGVLKFSLAKAINPGPTDSTSVFGFSIGTQL